MHFGIIKERKNPPDKRVVLSPEACRIILDKYPQASITVEPSDNRVFKDSEYLEKGITVSENLSKCDILLGVKEVPADALLPDKKYFFFSHTIKKQPHNRKLLQSVLEKNIELFDHEVITKANGQRLVAFGRYAGIVGAYNGFRALGLKFGIFNLPKAETLANQEVLIKELKKMRLPANLKILLTGKGRVGNGAKEMLDAIPVKKVTVNDFLRKSFLEPVYCQIDVMEYNKRKDGTYKGKSDFYKNPGEYESNFFRFAKVTDLYMAGHFFGDGAPCIFTKEDAHNEKCKIKVIADISCDVNGPIATTIRSSTIANPVYGYNVETGTETDYKKRKAIAVMAVDNLPCELPADSSNGFADMFVKYVIPSFFNGDKDGILARSQMTVNGELTERFRYLDDYVHHKD